MTDSDQTDPASQSEPEAKPKPAEPEAKPKPAEPEPKPGGALKQVAAIALAIGAMVLLMAWLSGAFKERIQPDAPVIPPRVRPDLQLITVQSTTVPVSREVTGSVAAEHETTIASQLLGRVLEVNAVAGRQVKGGDVLVRLEEAEHEARFAQAKALLQRADDHARRIERQHGAGTATESQLVQARTDREAARARLREARTFLAKTKILAPAA